MIAKMNHFQTPSMQFTTAVILAVSTQYPYRNKWKHVHKAVTGSALQRAVKRRHASLNYAWNTGHSYEYNKGGWNMCTVGCSKALRCQYQEQVTGNVKFDSFWLLFLQTS